MTLNDRTVNPSSLASVMRAIDHLVGDIKTTEKLRNRAVNLGIQDTRIQNPASVAMVFWGSLRQGTTPEDVLKSNSRAVLRLARELEKELYGHAS